ncbi:hypothetical protein ACIQNU_10070 [Streptomyces sp. NPDC091292]|uniref:hypothetical protein n=1 Tax=Streptomyces sp. NPDC091292 TaxID=3365991 RepID=UPI0038287EE7
MEWQWLSAGARAVPEPVATPLVWAGAFLGSAVLVAGLNQLGDLVEPVFYLVALSALAAGLGAWARVAAAPGTAGLCWLFLNGFGAPPLGELSWSGPLEVLRISCLLGAALVGTVISRLVGARSAYRRVSPP